MRTLPARIRPGVRLGSDYYVTDGQFIRDSAYRAIQRGLIGRVPSYREEWNRRQKSLVERAYPTIFSNQLNGATVYSEVYFKEPIAGQWVETDLVISFADVLNRYRGEGRRDGRCTHLPPISTATNAQFRNSS